MRPGQQNKRGRGRNNNNNRKPSNPLSRSYDSTGPDVKVRGTAQTIADKYGALARDAQSSGDRVMAENYLQHAEHYNRIIAAAQLQLQERQQREEANREQQQQERAAEASSDESASTEGDAETKSSSDENSSLEGQADGDERANRRSQNRRRNNPRQRRPRNGDADAEANAAPNTTEASPSVEAKDVPEVSAEASAEEIVAAPPAE